MSRSLKIEQDARPDSLINSQGVPALSHGQSSRLTLDNVK
jgi:hypothetical protein